MLFVNAALTPEPSGVGGIPPASDHNTCSVLEKLLEDQAASLKAGRAQTAANPKKKFSHGVREDGATERADEKFNKYAHMKNKNQKYGTE